MSKSTIANITKNSIIFFISLAVASALCFYLGAETKRAQQYDPTEAIIDWIEPDFSADEANAYIMHFNYEINGEKYSGESSALGGYEIGDTLEIVVDPEKPTDYFIGDTSHAWVVQTLGGVLAFAAVVVLGRGIIQGK